jgi:hypothetical protein
MPRPSPSLERVQRLAQAPVSSGINASPEPQTRAELTTRLSPGLERDQHLARAPASAPGFPRTTIVLRTWRKPFLRPTPIPVTPYLHCEYDRTEEGMGDVKSRRCCHNRAVTIPQHRTGDEASKRIATTQNRARQGDYKAGREDPQYRGRPPRLTGTTTPLPLP